MSDKSTEKVTKQEKALNLRNADKARELVQTTVIPDIRGEAVLLDKLAGTRQTKTEHAIVVLQTIGCISGGTWTGFPKWTTGTEATFADISRQLVPNPDGWVYIGTNRPERKNPDSLHKAGKCDKCDKSHELGELDYSDLVDKVANSLKLGANAAGRTNAAKRPNRDKKVEPDKVGEAPDPGEALEALKPDEVVKSVILPVLGREVAMLDSGESDILPDTMTSLVEACASVVIAWNRANATNPAKQVELPKPDKPVTPARRRAKAATR